MKFIDFKIKGHSPRGDAHPRSGYREAAKSKETPHDREREVCREDNRCSGQ
jgi:hypothetical protein